MYARACVSGGGVIKERGQPYIPVYLWNVREQKSGITLVRGAPINH